MMRAVIVVFYSSLLGLAWCATRPVIGILAQETREWVPYSQHFGSYISASYVKALDASGARVVPIFINRNESYYEDMASKLNGFVFPGGAADITSNTGYARSGRIIYKLVSDMNKKGKTVPILAICLGMELIGLITVGRDVRTPCPVENEALSLKFLSGYKKSNLYANISDKDVETLSKYNSTSNHHRYCVTQKTLSGFYDTQWIILSTSRGANSSIFISSMEMKNLPVAALIFHPEKNAYEWRENQENPHDARSIAAARHFYDWLLETARKNDNRYNKAADLMDDLIYNYNPMFTGKQLMYDFQDYYFD